MPNQRQRLASAPRLRSILLGIYRRYDSLVRRIAFSAWRVSSNIFHGAERTIAYRGELLWVRSSDWRAYWLASSQDANPHTRVLVERLIDQRPDLFVDVGANYGEFTVTAARRGIRVVAVEPNPIVASCLRRTTASFGPLVTICQDAASDRDDSSSQLWFSPVASGFSSLEQTSVASHRDPRGGWINPQSVEVPSRRITTILQAANVLGPDLRSLLLKIDVEGLELSVLRGAGDALNHATDWWAIIVEFDPDHIARAGFDPMDAWIELTKLAPARGYWMSSENLLWKRSEAGTMPSSHTDLLLGSGRFLVQ